MKIRLFLAGLLSAGLLFANAGNATLLTNSNFDSDDASSGDIFGATGWNAFGDSTFTTDGTNGPGALPNCCSPVANSLDNSFKVFGISGAYQSFVATAGQTYAGNGVGLNFGSDQILNISELLLQIAFFDGNGNPAGTAAGGSVALGFNLFNSNPVNASTPLDVWSAMGVGTAPAPDNTAEVRFIVLGLMGSGGAGFFDDTCFTLVVPGDPSPACNAVPLSGPVAGVPEPSVLAVLALGLAGLGLSRRKKEINAVRLD